MPQQLEKAVIKVLEGRNKGVERQVLFNPAEYNLEIGNNFQESALPGLSNPILQFVNGEAQTLSMELLFDTWTDGGREDVSKTTRKFAQMLTIDADLHAPPPVEFKWGGFAFKAVVDKLSQRFTMFNSDGRPVRATLNISFRQYRPLSEQLEKPRRNSADRTKRRVLTADDSLWAMAAREYGDPRFWRVIARHRDNRIENPRLLEAGSVILLPSVEDLNPEEVNDGSSGA
jgi:hypothetical protein